MRHFTTRAGATLGAAALLLAGGGRTGPRAQAQGALSSDGAMQGVTLGRTRVYNTRGVLEPRTVLWETGKLFVTKDSNYISSQVGPLSVGLWLPTNQGFSSPIVAGGTLYFTASIGDGYVFALDGATGRERWRVKWKGVALSPAAAAAGFVYVGASDGSFLALDAASGQERWRYTRKKGRRFMVSAPAVAEGTLYFGSTEDSGVEMGTGDGYLCALDAQTGAEKWSYKAKGVVGAPALDGEAAYFGSTDGLLYALDRRTGQERWKFKASGSVSPPALLDDLVYFYDRDGTPQAAESRTGLRRWKGAKLDKARTLLALYQGTVYYGGREHNLYALDAQTGAEKWQFKTNKPCNSPVIAGGLLYFSCQDGLLYAADAGTGYGKWKFKYADTVAAAPAIADGVLYLVNDDGHVYALR